MADEVFFFSILINILISKEISISDDGGDDDDRGGSTIVVNEVHFNQKSNQLNLTKTKPNHTTPTLMLKIDV